MNMATIDAPAKVHRPSAPQVRASPFNLPLKSELLPSTCPSSQSFSLQPVPQVRACPTGHGLNITALEVPEWMEAGSSASLTCSWAPIRSNIWALRWYQGLHEIYRWTPSKPNPMQIFHNPHLTVNPLQSSHGQVLITDVTHGAAGLFRCEISAEAPAFRTVYGEKELKVVTLPRVGPQIEGVQPYYREGDWIDLTCTAGPGRPAPLLVMLINGQLPGHLEPQTVQRVAVDNLSISRLHLRFVLRHFHLSAPSGVAASVRCVSRIPGINYEESSEVMLSAKPHYFAAGMDGRTTGGSAPLIVSGTWGRRLEAHFVATIVIQFLNAN
ncbi:Immunoglobulin-like domain [Trinorchestia longiramus]|nr:Immunoglobulin-like domain [Trinorchestia longiramus]